MLSYVHESFTEIPSTQEESALIKELNEARLFFESRSIISTLGLLE